jgi:hypothetical protein
MRFALRVSLLLLTLTTGLIVLVGGIGRSMGGHDPLQTVGFEVCAGKPCFVGLIPGETAWDSVKPALETNHIPFEATDSTFTTKIAIVTEDWLIEITSSPQRQRIALILWMYRHHPLSIGHFILMYGLPCRTWRSNGSSLWIASFRNLSTNAYSPATRTFSLQSTVYGFSLSDFWPKGCERLLNS